MSLIFSFESQDILFLFTLELSFVGLVGPENSSFLHSQPDGLFGFAYFFGGLA